MGLADTKPTRARYGIMGYLCALAFILYLDRNCIGQAATAIQKDLGLSNTQMGFVFGAFTVAYGLFEVVTGHWGDRFGSRRVLIRIVLWWSAFTALTGCIWKFSFASGLHIPLPGGAALPLVFDSFLLLMLIRFLFGAGEAGALPNTARVISRWFPPDRRGPSQSLINTATLMGGAVAPVVAAYLIREMGWRQTFWIFGSLGIVWAFFFGSWFRDDPAEHPSVNAAELRYIAGNMPPSAAPDMHLAIPWRHVLACPTVWLMGMIIICAAFFTYMVYSWLPKYFISARLVGEEMSGWLSGYVQAAGAVACILGGFLADYLTRRTGSRRLALRSMGVIGLGVASVAVAASIHCDQPFAAATLLAIALSAAAIQISAWWGAITDISGRHIGALFGLCNSMGVVGAFGSQVFLGAFADYRKGLGYEGRAQWDPAFYYYAGALFIGAVCWFFVNPDRSAVEPTNANGNSK